MGIKKAGKIWHNGNLIPWDDATVHVMSHVVNYGSSVFEGVRCYAPPSGPAIFRAVEHMQRLLDSAKRPVPDNNAATRMSRRSESVDNRIHNVVMRRKKFTASCTDFDSHSVARSD